MIFKGDYGENILQFGDGDIFIAASQPEGMRPSDIVAISFIPGDPRPIGSPAPEMIGKRDTDLHCHTRLIFHKPESIDVLIETLLKIKDAMLSDRANISDPLK
jgi:hypothetical protein